MKIICLIENLIQSIEYCIELYWCSLNSLGLESVECPDVCSCAWTYLDTLQSWTLGIPFELMYSTMHLYFDTQEN